MATATISAVRDDVSPNTNNARAEDHRPGEQVAPPDAKAKRKGSQERPPRSHRWLLQHRLLGPTLHPWNQRANTMAPIAIATRWSAVAGCVRP